MTSWGSSLRTSLPSFGDIFQAVEFVRMESCPAQAVLPLVGLAADIVIRNRDTYRRNWILPREEQLAGLFTIDVEFHSEMSNHVHVVLRPCLAATVGERVQVRLDLTGSGYKTAVASC